MPPQKIHLRSKDVAHILDLSPDDAINPARRGKLKATKKGRFWRFREAGVIAYKRRSERLSLFSGQVSSAHRGGSSLGV